MGKANIIVREIRYLFDDSEPDRRDGLGMMHIYIYTICEGDCPHMVSGWYHKAFPPGSTATDQNVMKSVGNYLLEFDRGAP